MGRTRCDCKQLSFVALRSFARRHGITSVDELIRRTGCCTGCGTCRPHLEEFLRTGEVDFGNGTRIKLPDPDTPTDRGDPPP
jgi:bacterioferritin-associated ferredoxin